MTDDNNIPKWWRLKDKPMKKREYTNISIPDGLRKEIERLFDDLADEGIDLGYSSLSEFVKDAIRKLLAELRASHLPP